MEALARDRHAAHESWRLSSLSRLVWAGRLSTSAHNI